MSTPQGCNDDSDVIETFKEALKQRVGLERFQIWFSGVEYALETSDESDSEDSVAAPKTQCIIVTAGGQFAADRLSKHYLAAMRGAAAAVFRRTTSVQVRAKQQRALPVDLPFSDPASTDPASTDPASTVDAPAVEAGRDSDSIGPKRVQSAGVVRSHPDAKSGSGRPSSRRGKLGGKSASGPRSLHAVLSDGTDSRKPVRSPAAANVNFAPPTSGGAYTAGFASAAQVGRSGSPPGGATPGDVTSAGAVSTQQSIQPGGSLGGSLGASQCAATWENFVSGSCNELARTACRMAIESPGVASPLVLWGPPGSGKSHLLHAVAAKLRSVHRMRRVVYLAAEEFTNDFIKALNGSCLPAFRSRFRDADALLIDDIQFFVEKKATIRELHHLIEMLAEVGKPLVFAGTKAPSEINGLGGELSGRLASGLVCQLDGLDEKTRAELLSRYAASRCPLAWPDSTLAEIAAMAGGDGRLLSGIVNLVALLQRMNGQMPSMDQIRVSGGHLLRSTGAPVTLGAIERAVEKVFQLENKSLQSNSQTKSVTEPRMLAMYLARELTSSAFSEIGSHFGGRSHSTAILANQRVRQWLGDGSSIGRGRAALSAEEAVRRIEAMLKTG